MGTKENGLAGFDTELKFNSPHLVQLLTDLADLQKDETFDYSGRTTEAKAASPRANARSC